MRVRAFGQGKGVVHVHACCVRVRAAQEDIIYLNIYIYVYLVNRTTQSRAVELGGERSRPLKILARFYGCSCFVRGVCVCVCFFVGCIVKLGWNACVVYTLKQTYTPTYT